MSESEPTVLVVGGGYTGRAAAKALDLSHRVTLVTERDAFLNNVATLRAVARRDFAASVLIPYDKLPTRPPTPETGRLQVVRHGCCRTGR